jgi:hypothetical protein
VFVSFFFSSLASASSDTNLSTRRVSVGDPTPSRRPPSRSPRTSAPGLACVFFSHTAAPPPQLTRFFSSERQQVPVLRWAGFPFGLRFFRHLQGSFFCLLLPFPNEQGLICLFPLSARRRRELVLPGLLRRLAQQAHPPQLDLRLQVVRRQLPRRRSRLPLLCRWSRDWR